MAHAVSIIRAAAPAPEEILRSAIVSACAIVLITAGVAFPAISLPF